MHNSHKATARLAPGQPLVFMASGVFKLAPVVENVEVAATIRGGVGDNDNDDVDDDNDDDDNNVSSIADHKRKAMGGPGGHYINK